MEINHILGLDLAFYLDDFPQLRTPLAHLQALCNGRLIANERSRLRNLQPRFNVLVHEQSRAGAHDDPGAEACRRDLPPRWDPR